MNKVNGNKLPKKVQDVEYNILQKEDDGINTKDSFFKSSQSKYSDFGRSGKVTINSLKDNNTENKYAPASQMFKPTVMPEHQIELNSGAHPTNMIIPKKGVTLTTGASTVQSYSQSTNGQYARIQKGDGKRMSRAQYAATIAVILSNFYHYLTNSCLEPRT